MEIEKHADDKRQILAVTGRIDSYWSSHLATELEKTLRQGAGEVVIDLAAVEFISSAGIGVLLKYYQILLAAGGSFRVVNPVPLVRSVLDLSGMSRLLLAETAPEPAPRPAETTTRQGRFQTVAWEAFDLAAESPMQCRVIGNPRLLESMNFDDDEQYAIPYPEGMIGLGVGALGTAGEDCRERFGEYLAAGGVSAVLPTDGANVPDYLLSAGTYVPEVQALYGIACKGPFGTFVRFEPDEDTSLSLSGLADMALEIAADDRIAIAAVVESRGLVGAWLNKSPRLDIDNGSFFDFPKIRTRLALTVEPAFPGNLALVVGVVSRRRSPGLDEFLRPIFSDPECQGHFHALTFTYSLLKKGKLDLNETVRTLFESEAPLGLLHLLHDSRHIIGCGESDFGRGACWIGRIGTVGT